MVQVEDVQKGKYLLKISNTDNFQDTVEVIKQNNASFDKKTMCWALPLYQLDDLKEDLSSIGENVEMSALAQKNYDAYIQSISELTYATSRRKLDWELMNYKPLEGKHPYEDYQLLDFKRALHQNRFLFNWEMGLGKSYVTAGLITMLMKYDNLKKAVILSSRIGCYNLANEILKFSKVINKDRIRTISSARDLGKDKFIFDNDDFDYYIMSYDMLKNISNAYHCRENKIKAPKTEYRKSSMLPFIESWFGESKTGIFLDEVHQCSHPSSRRTQILLQNIDLFEYRYLFTGTLADKYEKLYTPCRILDKRLVYGYSYNDWLPSVASMGNRFSQYAVGQWRMDKIVILNEKLINEYGSKRLCKDCLEIPPEHEKTFKVAMSPEQREIYEAFSNWEMAFIKNRSTLENFHVNALNMFQYFQIAVDNPKVLESNNKFNDFSPDLQKKVKSFKYENDFRKLDVVDALIEDHVDERDQKGIIWYIHPKTVESLAEKYKKYNPCVITSDLEEKERFAKIEKFKKDKSSKLLIASIYLLNTSVTLIECKWQVYVEATYDFTQFTQSRGRIPRPGQDEETFTYFIVYDKSLDVVQHENLRKKGELMASLMNAQAIEQSKWRELFNMELGG